MDWRNPVSDRAEQKTMVCGFGPHEAKDLGTRQLGSLNPMRSQVVQQKMFDWNSLARDPSNLIVCFI